MIFCPYKYQSEAIEFIIQKKKCMIMMEANSGKKAIVLDTLYQLKYDYFEEFRAVIVTSKYAARNVWTEEIGKWEQLEKLDYSIVVGTPKEKMYAVHKKADFYVTNYDAVNWLIKNRQWRFDVIILDEINEFKNPNGKRYREMQPLCNRAGRVVGLTGEPLPNELADLWAEIYLLDGGKRLEKSKKEFIEKYFFRVQTVHGKGYFLEPKKGAKNAIYKAIDDICYVGKKEDNNGQQNIMKNVVYVHLNSIEYTKYCWMRDEMGIQIRRDGSIDVRNKMELSTKLFQMANGAVYDNDKKTLYIHDRKIDALKELLRHFKGENVMIAYWFLHDKERVMSKIREARSIETVQDVQEWNQKKIKIGLIHPAEGSTGIDLSRGGNILIWFSLTWSLHLYQRLIWRMAGESPQKLYVEHIVTQNTIDEKIYEALQKKDINQKELLDTLWKRS